jgi:proline iminopeptidase
MILVGGSWGGTLAAHYLAAHPDRVEKVVFSSPGAI